MAGSQLKVVFSSRCWEAEVVDIEIWMDSFMSSILYLASFISERMSYYKNEYYKSNSDKQRRRSRSRSRSVDRRKRRRSYYDDEETTEKSRS